MKTELFKIHYDENGLNIQLTEGYLDNFNDCCVAGCIRNGEVCLGFLQTENELLKITDEDSEFYKVENYFEKISKIKSGETGGRSLL